MGTKDRDGISLAPDYQVKTLFTRMLNDLADLNGRPIQSLADNEDPWLWPKIFENVNEWAALLQDGTQKDALATLLGQDHVQQEFQDHNGGYWKLATQNLAILTSTFATMDPTLKGTMFQPWDVPCHDACRYIRNNSGAELKTEDQQAKALASMFEKFLLPRLAAPNFDRTARRKLGLTFWGWVMKSRSAE